MDPTSLYPGGHVRVRLSLFSRPYVAAMGFGASNRVLGGVALPFDLGAVGAPGNFLHHSWNVALPFAVRNVGIFNIHEGAVRVPRVAIGGMDLGPIWLRTREEMSADGGLIGSLGLDLLVGRLTLIDYRGGRLVLMSPGEAPAWLLKRATWMPAALRDGKCFLTITLAGATLPDMLFDTGSSAFDIVVDLDAWVELTGRAGIRDGACTTPTAWL